MKAPFPAIAAALRTIGAGYQQVATGHQQLAAALEAGQPHGDDWIDASESPRGRRWFWGVGRNREARGEAGVHISGRKCLMTRAALNEELERATKRGKAVRPAQSGGLVREELTRELRAVRGAGKR